MRKMRSPIVWFGGKGNMTAKILPLLPPHHTYVEPFGGGASILFAKEPSLVEVYNDLDSGLVNFFRIIRNKEQFAEFHRLVALTPWSREEYQIYRQNWEQGENPVERAYRWYVVARQSFSGKFGGSWSNAITATRRGMAMTVSRWLSTIEGLPQIAERLLCIQIEHKDWRDILKQYDTPETLFYLDPPYIIATRRGGKYAHEMTLEDHSELVDCLLSLQGKAVLSGYAHPIYEPLEIVGWQRCDFKTACYAVGKTKATKIQGKGASLRMQPRIESVWVKP